MSEVEKSADVTSADTEAEKKRKIEDSKIFFEQKKKLKQEEKEARAAAIARGELPLDLVEKPRATAPLDEPPLLSPHVQAIYAAFWDADAPPDALRLALQELLSVRQDIIAQTEEISQRDDISLQARRRAMKNVLADRLQCNFGQATMGQLASDPAVQALRKGVAKSMKQFIDHHPHWFTFAEEINTSGKTQQMVYLASGGSYNEWASTDRDSVEIRTQRLLFRMGEILERNGGSLSVSKLGKDTAVRQLRRGCASTLTVFLKKHPEFFNLEETDIVTEKGSTKELVCVMHSKPPELHEPMEEEEAVGEGSEEWSSSNPWELMMQAWTSWHEGGEGAEEQAVAAMAQLAAMFQYKGYSKGYGKGYGRKRYKGNRKGAGRAREGGEPRETAVLAAEGVKPEEPGKVKA